MSGIRCMRFFVCVLMAALFVGVVPSDAAVGDDTDGDRSSIRVLFVGPNPDDVRASIDSIMFNYERAEETYANHTPAFEALLKEHFETVGVVYGEDYTNDMSDDYDVTIFDATTPAQLPYEWNRAAIFVGYTGPRLLRGNEVKLDWL